VLKLLFRLFKYAMVAILGTAAAAKFLLVSNAEPDTEEIDMVSIFEGRTLASSADPFYGGRVLAMFSGTMIDLRKATPAPTGIDLELTMCFAGLSLVVPEGWRVRSDAQVLMGGFSDATRTTADPDAPTVRLQGYAIGSGIQVTTKAPMEVVR
jgi:hypothetical protein